MKNMKNMNIKYVMKYTVVVTCVAAFQLAAAYAAYAQRDQTRARRAGKTAVSSSVGKQQMKLMADHLKRQEDRSLAVMHRRVKAMDRHLAAASRAWDQAVRKDQTMRRYEEDVKKYLGQLKRSRSGKAALTTFTRFDQMTSSRRAQMARVSQNMPGVTRQTAALRAALARELGVSPNSVKQGSGYVVHASGELKKLMDAAKRLKVNRPKRPKWGSGAPGSQGAISPMQTLAPPFTHASQDDYLSSTGLAFSSAIMLGWPEAPAHAYSQCMGSALSGHAFAHAHGVVGESFQVPTGYTKLRVIAQIRIKNDKMHTSVAGFGSGHLKKKLTLGVVGPGQQLHVGSYELLNVTYSGVAPLGVGAPPTADLLVENGNLLIPVSLEFQIPDFGGQYTVSIMATTSLSVGAISMNNSANTGVLSIGVQRFEIEAYN